MESIKTLAAIAYSIEAVDKDGQEVHLKIEAWDEKSALTEARNQGYFPTQVTDSKRIVRQEEDVSRTCGKCGTQTPSTHLFCPNCKGYVPDVPKDNYALAFMFAAGIVGFMVCVPVILFLSCVPSDSETREYLKSADSSCTIGEYADVPTWMQSSAVNERILQKFHARGEALEYSNGDEFVRDLGILQEAERKRTLKIMIGP